MSCSRRRGGKECNGRGEVEGSKGESHLSPWLSWRARSQRRGLPGSRHERAVLRSQNAYSCGAHYCACLGCACKHSERCNFSAWAWRAPARWPSFRGLETSSFNSSFSRMPIASCSSISLKPCFLMALAPRCEMGKDRIGSGATTVVCASATICRMPQHARQKALLPYSATVAHLSAYVLAG